VVLHADPGARRRAATDADAAALIRKSTGIDLPFEILSTDQRCKAA
jgi:hypothetical protein